MAHISTKDKNLVAELSINNMRYIHLLRISGFPGGASGKEPTCQCRRCKRYWVSLSREDPLGKGMAAPSSVLAWRTPWTEEPGGLQSMGLQRAEHDLLKIQQTCTPLFMAELCTIAKTWKQPRYIMEYYSAMKKMK